MAGVEEGEEGEHGEEGGDGEDVDRGGGLLADSDLLVGDVVADRKRLAAKACLVSSRPEESEEKDRDRGGLGHTVAMPIQPGRRSRASRKPPRRERTVEVT